MHTDLLVGGAHPTSSFRKDGRGGEIRTTDAMRYALSALLPI